MLRTLQIAVMHSLCGLCLPTSSTNRAYSKLVTCAVPAQVDLALYVQELNISKVHWAMRSLKEAMKCALLFPLSEQIEQRKLSACGTTCLTAPTEKPKNATTTG